MRIVSKLEAENILRSRGLRSRTPQKRVDLGRLGDIENTDIGEYGDESNPNVTPQEYQPRDVFRGAPGGPGPMSIPIGPDILRTSLPPIALPGVPAVYTGYGPPVDFPKQISGTNSCSFNLMPFTSANTSVSVLTANIKRVFLLVQNQSAGTFLYVNFGVAASANSGIQLAAGQGLILDTSCPINNITAFFPSATPLFGIMVEGSRP